MRKSAQEKKAHLVNFSTKKDINVDHFYSFLLSGLFEKKYPGYLSEDLNRLMIPAEFDTANEIKEMFPEASQQHSDPLIVFGNWFIFNKCLQ